MGFELWENVGLLSKRFKPVADFCIRFVLKQDWRSSVLSHMPRGVAKIHILGDLRAFIVEEDVEVFKIPSPNVLWVFFGL